MTLPTPEEILRAADDTPRAMTLRQLFSALDRMVTDADAAAEQSDDGCSLADRPVMIRLYDESGDDHVAFLEAVGTDTGCTDEEICVLDADSEAQP